MTDTQQSNEREQVAEVFGLTGGELEDTPWEVTYAEQLFTGGAERRMFTFTYWYQGVPEYELACDDADHEYRTVCRDEMFGRVPVTVTDADGTWTVVGRYSTSGEC